MNRKIILLVFAFILVLSISSVSAMFSQLKQDSSLKSGLQISTAANEYPAVQIKDWFGLGAAKADLVLTDHTPSCTDCNSKWDITTYQDSALVDSLDFYTINADGSREKQDIRSHQLYIQNGTTDTEVPDYEWQCNQDGYYQNGTAIENCANVQIGTHSDTQDNWIPYTIGQIEPAGDYKLSLDGQKVPDRTVDWQISSQGQLISDWSTWGSGNVTAGLVSYYNMSSANESTVNRNYIQPYNLSASLNFTTGGIISDQLNTWTQPGQINTSLQYNPYTNGSSFNFWFNQIAGNGGSEYLVEQYNPGNNSCLVYLKGIAGTPLTYNISTDSCIDNTYTGTTELTRGKISQNRWYMFTMTRNLTGFVSFYLNGTFLQGAQENYNPYTRPDGTIYLGQRENQGLNSFGWRFNGIITELSYFNTTLTNTTIDALYNNGAGSVPTNGGSSITLNSPPDNYTSQTKKILFNATAIVTGGAYITTAYFWSNYSLVTNLSGPFQNRGLIQNFTGKNLTTTEINITKGNYPNGVKILWSIQACDSDGDCGFSENRTFTVDTTPPNITIITPTSIIDYGYIGKNVSLNYSAIDNVALSSCWFNYNNQNYSTSCTSNSSFILQGYVSANKYFCSGGICPPNIPTNTAVNYSLPTQCQINAPSLNVTNDPACGLSIKPSALQCYNNTAGWTTIATYGSCASFSTGDTYQFINSQFLIGNSISVYANDTTNNVASNITSWNYTVFDNNRTFNPSAFELSNQVFGLNFNYLPSYTGLTVDLIYNGTDYPSTNVISGNNIISTSSLIVPLQSGSSNRTFFWSIILSNVTTSINVNTSSSTQSVSPISIDDCSVNTFPILNYTMYDEDAGAFLNGTLNSTHIEIDMKISNPTNVGIYKEINFTRDAVNPIAVCIPVNVLNTTTYRLDGVVKYSANGYVTKYNYIQNYTLSNMVSLPYYINLYDLIVTRSTEFLTTYEDSNQLPVLGIVLQVWRRYIGEGVFKLVEAALTDSNGRTALHLVLSNEIYNIVATKDNHVIYTLNNSQAICPSAPCAITLVQGSNSGSNSLNNAPNLMYSFNVNTTTRTISITYATIDSSVTNVTLDVQSWGASNIPPICLQSLISSSGTITCTIPSNINGTFISNLLQDSNFVQSQTYTIPVYVSLMTDADRNTGIVMGAFAYLTLALLGFSSGPIMVVFALIGLIFIALMNFVSNGVTAVGVGSTIVWFIVAGAILIWKMNDRRGN